MKSELYKKVIVKHKANLKIQYELGKNAFPCFTSKCGGIGSRGSGGKGSGVNTLYPVGC